MTLPELCEQLFQYMCMVNRAARTPTGAILDYEGLRETVQEAFTRMKNNSKDDPRLSAQLAKVEEPLIFFVDSMIADSSLPLAPRWHKERFAYARGELAGDEKFFEHLDETLATPGPEATERLMIFYTCIGLGFTGWYAGQPVFLRERMMAMAKRLEGEIDLKQTARLTPEAYEHLDRRDLIEAPGVKLATLAIALAGMLIVVVAVNFYLFHEASSTLAESLGEILKHDRQSAAAR